MSIECTYLFLASFKTIQEFSEEINEQKISLVDSNIFWNKLFTSRENFRRPLIFFGSKILIQNSESFKTFQEFY